MAWGLPKLPGLTFSDPSKTQFNMNSSLQFYQGHRWPKTKVRGSGGSATDVDSNAFALAEDAVNYDPSLTYGRVKQAALAQVIPHWVHYDKKCLKFVAFMKQPVYDNPIENFRVRIVNLIYFLEDDSMVVAEPKTPNSGIWQGRMVKRGKIPKNNLGEFWHWKDLDNGKDICIYGKVFHTVSCDLFTKEYLESQGIELSKEEDLPIDQYTKKEMWKNVPIPHKSNTKTDKLRRFLEYDGKVLAFNVVWDDRDSAFGELVELKMLYFLEDDRISIKEIHDGRGGKDPFPLLLKKTKLPKKWKDRPVTFPSSVLEITDDEVTEYYAPKDLIVGQTVFVFGRRLLIYDCDPYTRNYYRSMLNLEQPPRVELKREKKKEFAKTLPPHLGFGSAEDALQSCFGLEPKRPWKDIIKYNLNAAKKLRYLCELVPIHPEDVGRRFILQYNLGDGTVRIDEIKRRNSGIREGAFLKSMKLQLPNSDRNFPTYYTPDKFFIGAELPVFKHRFKIIGCDLYVYRYMSANPEKFPQEVIDNVRNYHMSAGNLKDELAEAISEDKAATKRAQLQAIGQEAVAEPSPMQRCMADLKVVEGSAIPTRPPTPPMTTDIISYDDSLRATRGSKLTCDNVQPLKGILKAAGAASARDDQQKVVCFTGPKEEERKPDEGYAPDRPPRFYDDPNYCRQYKDKGWELRAERRARGECNYDIIPNEQQVAAAGETEQEKEKLQGYLGSYGVDCKEVPEYMRLASDAYEKVKKLRKEVPDISPAAQRVADYPRIPPPPVDACINPPPEQTGPCAPYKAEDVAFSCPHVEPRSPCCDPDKRPKEHEKTHL